jgi:hypothetical protein
MNTDIIITGIVSIVTGWIGFMTGKKKTDAEADSTTIDNVEKALAIYKSIIDDMKVRYDRQLEEMNKKLLQYEQHIAKLEDKIKELKR